MAKLNFITPLISVIIPTFNRGYCLKRCINSVLSQSYEKLECIIIDNNSNDDSKKIFNSINDSRFHYYTINNDNIIAKSRNFGIKRSKGELIAFLDSDDWWEKNKLKKILLEISKGADIVYHNLKINYTNENQKFLKRKFIISRKIRGNSFKYLINNGNPIPLSSVVIKKRILMEIGGFDENKNLAGAEDYYLWIKVALRKHKFKKINLNLGNYSFGDDSFTSSKKATIYFEEIFKNLFNKKLIKNKEIPSWAELSIGYTHFKEGNLKKSFSKAIRSILKINPITLFKSLVLIVLIFNVILQKTFKLKK